MSTPAIGVLFTPPAQPATEYYSTDNLRMAYPRPWQPGDQYNAAAPIKGWKGSGSFTSIDPVSGVVSSFTVPASQDAVNLPTPAGSYPAWVPAPTVAATKPGAVGQYSAITPYLSTIQQAEALMQELNGSNLVDGGAQSINYGTETRRCWDFTANGQPVNAGVLLAQQYAAGVGAPGYWTGIIWTALPPSAVPAGAEVSPDPYRALLPNEQVVIAMKSVVVNTYQIQRTDLIPAASSVGAAALTGAQASAIAMIPNILSDLQALAKAMGGIQLPY